MAQSIPAMTVQAGNERSLPLWLQRYTKYALYGLVVGTGLCFLALFTNPVPDPSFPWFSLPPSYRLPITQPRIEHWPVSYSVGIWLWIAGFPALFLWGYEQLRVRWRRGGTMWLIALPTLSMLAWTTYCRFFWPKLMPATWNAPSYTFVCWLYCSTYDPVWSDLAYAVAFVGAVGSILLLRDSPLSIYVEAAFGVLAFPLGLPAFYDAYRRSSA